jgi:hypothetical protein
LGRQFARDPFMTLRLPARSQSHFATKQRADLDDNPSQAQTSQGGRPSMREFSGLDQESLEHCSEALNHLEREFIQLVSAVLKTQLQVRNARKGIKRWVLLDEDRLDLVRGGKPVND